LKNAQAFLGWEGRLRTSIVVLAGLLVAVLLPSTVVARGPAARFSIAPNDAPATMEGLQLMCLLPATCPMNSDNYDTLKKALKGDLYSQYVIGLNLIQGEGVPMDGKAGRQWIVLAAEAGFPPAVRYVEKGLQNGENIEVDETRMANELKKQVEKGSTSAMRALGPMMIRGRGTAQDPEGGVALLLKAAEAGAHGDAEYEIGDLYLLGTNGLKSDREQAMKWYAKAASRGNVRAMSVLSGLWENEPGIDPRELLKQAQSGQPLHIPERKFKRNVVQSYCWRMRAALLDDGIAQYEMALMRSRRNEDSFDNVIEADLLEADFWFRLGARNREHDNSQVRGALEPKMTTAQLDEVKRRVAAWKKLDFDQMKAAAIPIPGDSSRTCPPMP
jgi:TPR repeat protein